MDDAVNYSMSFSGCGFLCMYHAGVVAAVKEYAPQLTRNKVYGASAGAIAACAIVCNVCISKAVSIILAVVMEAKKAILGPLDFNFKLMELIRVGLEDSLPANAHVMCTDKLIISLTRVRDGKNVFIDKFETREELIQAILCSCFIPFYCGFNPPYFRGEQYWDGGLSNNQPIFDDHTITVSPFNGESDICPSDFDSASLFGFDFSGTSIRFTSQNLFRVLGCVFPLTQENCSRLCRQGFEDAVRFMTRTNLTPCARCLTVSSSVLPLPIYTAESRNSSGVSLKNRARMNSECDRCFEKVEPKVNSGVTTLLFPPLVQKTLDEAKSTDHWLIDYMYQFKAVRYTWRAFFPAAVSLQYALYGLERIIRWLASLTKMDAMLIRFKEMILFVTRELEKVYGPVSRLSCYLPLLHSKKPTSSVDATPRTDKIKFDVIVPGETQTIVSSGSVDDEDSIGQLVDYCQERDAVLAYYYTDDQNRTQVCEIFDMENPHRASRCHSTCGSAKTSAENTPLVPVNEENECNPMLPSVGSSPLAEDSGLSLTEDNGYTNKRDVGCSPVRQLSTSRSLRGSLSQRRPAGMRRAGAKISNAIPQSSCSMDNVSGLTSTGGSTSNANQSNNIMSSDSDPDTGGEMFFVTNRRKRTGSNDYDGDPEQSDTDNGC